MEIFADSANLDDIIKLSKAGIINGVTTNPKLCRNLEQVLKIADATGFKVSYQPQDLDKTSLDTILNYRDKLMLKIPPIMSCFTQVSEFIPQGLDVNVTLVFDVQQAILAAKLGATYVSIFVGRLEDNGHDPFDIIAQVRDIYDANDIKTKIIAASIRNVQHISDSFLHGAHVVTAKPEIIFDSFDNELTQKGIQDFLKN